MTITEIHNKAIEDYNRNVKKGDKNPVGVFTYGPVTAKIAKRNTRGSSFGRDVFVTFYSYGKRVNKNDASALLK